MQVTEGKGVVEWLKELWPFILPILSAAAAWLVGERMRDAQVTHKEAEAKRTEAEAKRTLAEAEKLMAEADTEDAHNMTAIIGAWRTLYDQVKDEMQEIRDKQEKAHEEHNRVLAELKRYKRGVRILVQQLREHGIEPRWTPDMPHDQT